MTTMVKSRVGSVKWRNETIQLAGESDKLARKIEKESSEADRSSIGAGARQGLTQLSNHHASLKYRMIRQQCNLAREGLIDVNEQIRSMGRAHGMIRKMKDKLTKVVEKNKICYEIRRRRPEKEKMADSADMLLQNEEKRFKKTEKALERFKGKVDECSSGLLQQRKELTAYINFYTPFLSITSDNTLPQNNNNISSGGGDDDDDDGLKKVLEEAKVHSEVCKGVRKDVEEHAKEFEEEQKGALVEVDEALKNKMKETRELKTDIRKAIEKNKQTVNKSISLFHHSQHSWFDMNGPESSSSATASEHSDRPMVKNLHSPTHQLLEAQQLKTGSESLLKTMQKTAVNIDQLRWMEGALKEDERSKRQALRVDRQAVVARRRK